MMENFNSIDIFWRLPSDRFSPKRAFIYVQGELGFVPFIVGSGVTGPYQPDAEVWSKHHVVEVFNKMPDPLCPAWTITQVNDDTAFVNLTSFHILKMMPDGNPKAWAETYPVMRDLCMFLKHYGVEELTFLTGINHTKPEMEPQLLVESFHDEVASETPLMLNLPAWAIPMIWDRMGGKANIVAVTQDEGQFVDEQALKLMEEYILDQGIEYHIEWSTRCLVTIMAMRDNLERIERSFDLFPDADEDGEWI